MSKKKKDHSKRSTIILIIIVVICIVIGIYVVMRDLVKVNKAAGYSEKILNLYLDANDK